MIFPEEKFRWITAWFFLNKIILKKNRLQEFKQQVAYLKSLDGKIWVAI